MKRRRKNLSGTQAEHEVRQDAELRRAGRALLLARRAVREDRCDDATGNLLHAADAFGAYNAEKSWTEKNSVDQNRINNEYADVRQHFFERCVVGRNR
jgi:multidrug efflux pump subunit AcrA (membrane-fusion protein)